MVVRAHRKYWDLLPWEEDDSSTVPPPPATSSFEEAIMVGGTGAPSYTLPEGLNDP